ncbi:thioesterase II family protein [Streptomyces sp. NPDC048337]|uniref:thioesterase II family protein n=1 Tax=Streptomyces sp. NPDC048337 TaxID=3365535 RepID=UPI0037222726
MAHDDSAGARWLRLTPAGYRPRLRLVCFPHAGGAAGFYRDWPALMPAGVELVAVQYPGRQDRLTEPRIESMEEMTAGITGALLPVLDTPVAFFGHSMGSAIAYETALRLERRHGVVPVRLFVSGRGAPHAEPAGETHLGTDDHLVASVRALGDLDAGIYDEPELRDLLLPTLRSDYKLIETHSPDRPVPVSAPVSALGGDDDPGCAPDELLSWKEVTTARYDRRVFPGDHFYLAAHRADVVAHVTSVLRLHPQLV